jgi:alkanesulfonate monooxygenase
MIHEAEDTIHLYSTCPPFQGQDSSAYLRKAREVSRWSDEAGCKGMLIYTDNSLPDPWLLAQIVIESTQALEPLVAVQPVYSHPYTVAKMVSTLSVLHGRRICLNMVAGGFTNDLKSLADSTPHDRRYDRLIEYTTIIQRLLEGTVPVTFQGEFYQTEQLTLRPALPKELYPVITVSGSSPAGLAAAEALGAIAVEYPQPLDQDGRLPNPHSSPRGIRIGIVSRESEDEAWRVADERFPLDRKGEIAHRLAMKSSDSAWHRALSATGEATEARSTYWLGPFQHYKTFCPYLVGSYDQVATYVGRYLAEGFTNFILDVPANKEDLAHIGIVFATARGNAYGPACQVASRHNS